MNEQPTSPQEPKKSFWAKLFGGGKKQQEAPVAPVVTPVANDTTIPAVESTVPTVPDVASPEPIGMPASGMIGNEIAGATVASPVSVVNPVESPGFAEQPITPVAAPDPALDSPMPEVVSAPEINVEPSLDVASSDPIVPSEEPITPADATTASTLQNEPIQATPLQTEPPIADPVTFETPSSDETGSLPPQQ